MKKTPQGLTVELSKLAEKLWLPPRYFLKAVLHRLVLPSLPGPRVLGLLGGLMVLVAINFCGAATAEAYQLQGHRWPRPYTTFYVAMVSGPEFYDYWSGTSGGRWNDAFSRAMNDWSDATNFEYIHVLPFVYSDPCDQSDKRNGVGFNDTVCGDAWGSSTLAVTGLNYSGETIEEADIVFNGNLHWSIYYSDPWSQWSNDFHRVAVHELGHALGLDHEDSGVASIMTTYAGDITVPQQDDTNGVAAIYEYPVFGPIIPDAPIIGMATAGDGQATVSFSPPASDGGSTITGYTVTAYPGGQTASGTGSPLIVSGLTNGRIYNFTVTATNAFGNSSPSLTSNSVTPLKTIYTVTTNNGATAIYAAGQHTIALKGDGSVVAWGYNNYGQITVPLGLSGVIAIAAGASHTLALKSDGSVVAWGDNSSGQTTVPSGLSGVTAIAAGVFHSMALKEDGTVVAWGDNFSGQATVPSGLSGVTAIAAGHGFSVALKSNGSVIAWGATTVPSGLSGVTAIVAGSEHIMAVKSDGTVVAWGDNSSGRATVPSGLSGVTAIAAGAYHTVALKGDGTVVTWGGFFYGQNTVPNGLSGVIAIAAGGFHSVALKNNGTVVAWGDNSSGQTTVPSSLSEVIAISAGAEHTVALKSDGSVVAWGYNLWGQTAVPDDLSAGGSPHGTFACDSRVSRGGNALCTITPGTGYRLASFTVNGTDQLANVTANRYTITNVQSNVSVNGSFVAHTAATTQYDCLFSWGENNYASLFSPQGVVSQSSNPWYYRYYQSTNSALGVSSLDNHLYYLDPAGQLNDEGLASTWISLAGCQ